MDPGGNAAVYTDIDGDGDNEYYGQVNPGDPGYEAISCGCPGALGGDNPSASDWVDINNAWRGQQLNEQSKDFFAGRRTQPDRWLQVNQYISQNSAMKTIVGSELFYSTAINLLKKGGAYTGVYSQTKEIAGAFYVDRKGNVRFVEHSSKNNSAQLSYMSKPTPRKGEVGVTFHTHPWNGGPPSKGDVQTARNFSAHGLIATHQGYIYGYGPDGAGAVPSGLANLYPRGVTFQWP